MLDSLRGRRILLAGDIMLDRYVEGEVSRISPEAPVPVVSVLSGGERRMPGGAANVAMNLRALGGEVWLAGLVGDDEEGVILLEMLSDAGIDCGGVRVDPGRMTTTKTRIMCGGHQMLRIDRETCAPPPPAAGGGLLDAILARLPWSGAVVFEDYDKGALHGGLTGPVISAARASGIPVAVDPKLRNYAGYRGCTLFKPNRQEASAIVGREVREPGQAEEAAARIMEDLGARAVLVTLGERGSVLLVEGRRPVWIETAARRVFDVSGAGDAVIAVMGLCLAAGADLEGSARLANLAAAAVCSRPGVYAVRPGDILGEAGL